MSELQNAQLSDFVSTSGPAFKPLSKEDVAAILGVSTRTVENWRKEGRIPPSADIGGRVYWHPEVFFAGLNAALRGNIGAQEGVGQPVKSSVKSQLATNRPSEVTGAVERSRKKTDKLIAAMTTI
jgi:hypothetical protein